MGVHEHTSKKFPINFTIYLPFHFALTFFFFLHLLPSEYVFHKRDLFLLILFSFISPEHE